MKKLFAALTAAVFALGAVAAQAADTVTTKPAVKNDIKPAKGKKAGKPVAEKKGVMKKEAHKR